MNAGWPRIGFCGFTSCNQERNRDAVGNGAERVDAEHVREHSFQRVRIGHFVWLSIDVDSYLVHQFRKI